MYQHFPTQNPESPIDNNNNESRNAIADRRGVDYKLKSMASTGSKNQIIKSKKKWEARLKQDKRKI